jgi:hypothetical protein
LWKNSQVPLPIFKLNDGGIKASNGDDISPALSLKVAGHNEGKLLENWLIKAHCATALLLIRVKPINHTINAQFLWALLMKLCFIKLLGRLPKEAFAKRPCRAGVAPLWETVVVIGRVSVNVDSKSRTIRRFYSSGFPDWVYSRMESIYLSVFKRQDFTNSRIPAADRVRIRFAELLLNFICSQE